MMDKKLINKEKVRCACGCIMEKVGENQYCDTHDEPGDFYKCNNEQCYLNFIDDTTYY